MEQKKTPETQYQKKLKYNNEYNRKNYRSFSIRFNISDEAEIIEWLESRDGVKAYLNDLIRSDMKKQAKKADKKKSNKKKSKKD